MKKVFLAPFFLIPLLFVIVFGLKFEKDDQNQDVLSQNDQITANFTPSSIPLSNTYLEPASELEEKSAESNFELSSDLYKVVKVIDGDTIDVLIDGKAKTLRLIGIDTPETVDPRSGVQCFGREASAKAKELLTGKMVYLEIDSSQGELDKYQRLLRYVFLEDGTNFNEFMIRGGFAHEYTYDLPYKYQIEFKEAEREARENGIGLWSKNACLGNASYSSGGGLHSDYKPTGAYTCDCSKFCSKILTCDEAYYQLNNCGCSTRDSDGDGVPCESLCR